MAKRTQPHTVELDDVVAAVVVVVAGFEVVVLGRARVVVVAGTVVVVVDGTVVDVVGTAVVVETGAVVVVVVSCAHAPPEVRPVTIGAETTTTRAAASLRAFGCMRAA